MKIRIQFTPEERAKAEPVIFSIMRLIPHSRTVCNLDKASKDGFITCYISEIDRVFPINS